MRWFKKKNKPQEKPRVKTQFDEDWEKHHAKHYELRAYWHQQWFTWKRYKTGMGAIQAMKYFKADTPCFGWKIEIN